MQILQLCYSPQVSDLTLSKNHFGKSQSSKFGEILATNETLEELFLEGNPLSSNFARSILRALESNTTLRRLGFMKSYMGKSLPIELDTEIRNLVTLNEAGRRWLRNASGPNTPSFELAVLPHLLHRTSDEPNSLFGVLREYTNLWVKP